MERVERVFRAQHQRGAFSAGQLVVQRGNDRLVDLALGDAISAGSRFQVMSASKMVLSRLLCILDERGLLDVNAPIRTYISEFSVPEVTVREVLTHRAGVTLPELSRKPDLWHDWKNVVAALRDEPASFARGTLAYSPIAFGWVLGEVLQRITGRSLIDFSAQELGNGFAWQTNEPGVPTLWRGKSEYMLNGANLAAGFEQTNNTISARTALVPGAGLYTTARDLAGFYAALLANPSPRLLEYSREHTRGLDKNTGAYLVLGLGCARGWFWPHPHGWWGSQHTFGHAGGFSVVAYADRSTGAAVAIVTDTNRGVSDLVQRFAPLSTAIRRAL